MEPWDSGSAKNILHSHWKLKSRSVSAVRGVPTVSAVVDEPCGIQNEEFRRVDDEEETEADPQSQNAAHVRLEVLPRPDDRLLRKERKYSPAQRSRITFEPAREP